MFRKRMKIIPFPSQTQTINAEEFQCLFRSKLSYRNPDGTYTEFDAVSGSGGGGESITVDGALSTTSENPVQNKVITGALNTLNLEKQDVLTFDTKPTAGSSNPVSSDGVKIAIPPIPALSLQF